MSKLPDDLKWSEEVLALLAETDKTSCKSVCIAFGKASFTFLRSCGARVLVGVPVLPEVKTTVGAGSVGRQDEPSVSNKIAFRASNQTTRPVPGRYA